MSDPATANAPPIAPALSRRESWELAITATLTMAVSYVDRQTLAVVAPDVQKALHLSEVEYGTLISAFAFAYLVGTPLAGRLMDRVGARRGLLGAVIVWSIAAAAHALAPGFAALFMLRILLGLAESPSFPGAVQTVHRALPPADRARGIGILFTGSSFGAMVAPPLATWLAHRYDYRYAFVGTALVGLAWVPLWIRVAWKRGARAVLAQAPPSPSVGIFTLVKHPAVLRAVLVVIASAPMLALLFNWTPKYLVHDHHLEQFQTGKYLIFPPLFFDGGSIVFGHLASNARARGAEGVPRSLIAAACLIMMTGAAIPFMPGPVAAVAMISVSLVGGGGLYALATADMLPRVPPGRVSSAGGLTAAAQSIAHVIVGPLIGWSIAASGSYTTILVILSLWTLPGCVAWLLWKPPPAYREPEARVVPLASDQREIETS